MITKTLPIRTSRGYFRFDWAGVYRFWVPKLVKPEKKVFVKANIDIFRKYFSFLAYQRSVRLLYETLETLRKALRVFIVRHSYLCRQTDRPSKILIYAGKLIIFVKWALGPQQKHKICDKLCQLNHQNFLMDGKLF